MLFGIVNVGVSSPPRDSSVLTPFGIGYSLYQAFAPAFRSNGIWDRAFRILVGHLGHLERTLVRVAVTLRLLRAAGSRRDELLAVYSLVDSGLTFDLVVFLARAEIERVRLGLKSTRVLLYVPYGMPIYQWRNRKTFHNMNGLPLFLAPYSATIEYVKSMARAGHIFPGITRIEVTGKAGEVFAGVCLHRHVYPAPRPWGGRFPSRTHYNRYLEAKYAWNGGRELTASPKRLDPHRITRRPDLSAKLLVTVNMRNQSYTTNRNGRSEEWVRFLTQPIIRENFHLFVFNDAENPIDLPPLENVTLGDSYIADNFRRSKAILNIGLHIGNVSGSSVAAIVSDTPYLYFGEGRPEDWKDCLLAGRFVQEGHILLFDRAKRHQRIAFHQEDMLGDFQGLLESIRNDKALLARYGRNFNSNLERTLHSWPDSKR